MVEGIDEIQKTCGDQCKEVLKAPNDSLCQAQISKVLTLKDELNKINSKDADEEGVKKAQEGVKKIASELSKEIEIVQKKCTP